MTNKRGRNAKGKPGDGTSVKGLDKALWFQFKVACVEDGRFIGPVLNTLIADYLACRENAKCPQQQ